MGLQVPAFSPEVPLERCSWCKHHKPVACANGDHQRSTHSMMEKPCYHSFKSGDYNLLPQTVPPHSVLSFQLNITLIFMCPEWVQSPRAPGTPRQIRKEGEAIPLCKPVHHCKAIKPIKTPWDERYSINLSYYYYKTNLHRIS